jgi:nucleotide-binding universal stress UspA family protein
VAKIFQRILVPHDLSEPASKALRTAAELAREAGGELMVAVVLPPVTSLAGISPPGHPVWLPSKEELESARKQLTSLVEEALGPYDPPPAKICVLAGEPFEEIMRLGSEVDCIVMATQGRTGLAHLLIGSLAEKVVRHAPVPVLTLGPAALRSRSQTGERPKRTSGVRRAQGKR